MSATRGRLRRRWAAALLGTVGAAGLFLACTLTQSLDYLQKGGGPDAADVVSEQPSPVDGALANVLVPNQTKPGLLAQDDAALYWVAAGAVFSVPKSGGTPKKLGTTAAAGSLAAEPDPNGAVFLTVGRDVIRLAKNGSGGATIFKGAADSPQAAFVIADTTSVFLLQSDNTVGDSFVLRMAKDGGAAVNIAPDSGPAALAADTKNVLWLDPTQDNGTWYELPKTAAAGTPPKVLPLGMNDEPPTASENVVADSTALYWATLGNVGTPDIVSRRRDPASPVIALYRGVAENMYGAVAVDDAYVYVIESRANAILRVPKMGGKADTLITGLPVARGLVVDATSVYVTVEATGNTGALLKIAKK